MSPMIDETVAESRDTAMIEIGDALLWLWNDVEVESDDNEI